MKIKSIQMTNFKRFTDLTISEIHEKVKLVVMIGPNGSGKSSVFDALQDYRVSEGRGTLRDDPYYIKCDSSEKDSGELKVDFHGGNPQTREEWRKSVHIRSPYRNDLAKDIEVGAGLSPVTEEYRFGRLAENDEAVSSNYSRLLNQWIQFSSARERRSQIIDEIQNEVFGELRERIERLFSDTGLILNSLGNPANGDIFQFNKGTSQGFSYHNLSSGEKAALDLLLDMTIVRDEFNNSVYCIDEPEAHMHTKLQGQLLEQLYELVPDNSQLWIATHSIGMVCKAQDLWYKNRDSIVFLDFGSEDLNYDGKAIITPDDPNPNLWERTYEVALGDLVKLVAPKRIILCEGTDFDADCYNRIFGTHYPDTRFVSIGNCEDVERANIYLIPVIEAIVGGARTLRLRDRDEADEQEIEDNAKEGVRTLSRRNIEGYLLDDEVLTKFCEDHGIPDKVQELLDAKQDALTKSIADGKSHDDMKPTAQGIHVFIRNAMRTRKIGNKSRSFMKNHLAPLIKPGMCVYEQLHDDIFGE